MFMCRPYLFVSQRTFARRSIANRFKPIKTLTNARNLYIHGKENIALSCMKVNTEENKTNLKTRIYLGFIYFSNVKIHHRITLEQFNYWKVVNIDKIMKKHSITLSKPFMWASCSTSTIFRKI